MTVAGVPAVFLEWECMLARPSGEGGRLRRRVSGALSLLTGAGYRVVALATSPGVAMGAGDEETLCELRSYARTLLGRIGVPLEALYYCPHDPDGLVASYAVDCRCRRPQPGLILQAARERALDVDASWMVGGLLDDVEAGRRAGCRTILVGTGLETRWELGPNRIPHHIAADLGAAASIIGWIDRRDRSGRGLAVAGA